MTTPEQRSIDWGSADVEAATLTVELTGASSKAWTRRFESVLALLETTHSRWGEVRLKSKSVQVAAVQPGTETELRHFLESIVLQVNSELPQPQEAQQDTQRETPADEQAQADRQMSAAFKAFAGS
jgi:hypothetical protein